MCFRRGHSLARHFDAAGDLSCREASCECREFRSRPEDEAPPVRMLRLVKGGKRRDK
jgi:hypothetical protein